MRGVKNAFVINLDMGKREPVPNDEDDGGKKTDIADEFVEVFEGTHVGSFQGLRAAIQEAT